jgi:hypothetical protein
VATADSTCELIQCWRAGWGTDNHYVLGATASLARLFTDWAWAERTNIVAAEVTRLASSGSLSLSGNSRTAEPSLVTSAATTPYERAREAERLLREVLALRSRDSTNSLRVADVKSRLGGALVSRAVTDPAWDAQGRRAKLSEAESLRRCCAIATRSSLLFLVTGRGVD